MNDSTRAQPPPSSPAPPVPDSVQPSTSDEADLTHLPPEYRAAIRRLRTQVDRATAALERLRSENEHLRRRVKELEQRPAIQPNTTTLVLDNDPDALRDRITTFIDAIDTYLENGTAPPDVSSAPDPST